MGTWDATSFGNDTACDFAGNLVESGDLTRLAEALREAADTEDYLDGDEAQQAIGAAETVAAMNGAAGAHLPGDLAAWVAAQGAPDADLKALALRALDRIVAPDSELKELWEEADAAEWLAEIDALRQRLA